MYQVCKEMLRDKKSWKSAWLDTQKRLVLVRSRLVVKQVRRASKRKDVCTGTPPLGVMGVVLPRTSRGHGSCIGLSNVSVVFFRGDNEAELLVCLTNSMRKDETTWKLLKAVHGTQVGNVTDWINMCCRTLLWTNWMWCLVRCYCNEWHDT